MPITFATVPTATLKIVPDAISEFRARGQSERIRISDLSTNEVLTTVEEGEVEFGITIIGANSPDLDFKDLRTDEFVLVLRADDPIAEKSELAWNDIDSERFIAVWQGSGNRMLIDSSLARTKQSMDWAFEVRHLSSALALVEAGVGVTVLPESALAGADNSKIVTRPLVDPVVSRTMGTITRSGEKLKPATALFVEILHEV
ncbi:MAG TPA: LysR family transcriptional regulator, partial [Rhodospirillaceae bacterium]|nr:LysR family transcriptional regulator [Rhodospirillaceae bacterium]